jgi:hypothetical protein
MIEEIDKSDQEKAINELNVLSLPLVSTLKNTKETQPEKKCWAWRFPISIRPSGYNSLNGGGKLKRRFLQQAWHPMLELGKAAHAFKTGSLKMGAALSVHP